MSAQISPSPPKGTALYIRTGGTPNTPESWEYATWDGVVWRVPFVSQSTGLRGERQVRAYLLVEAAPSIPPYKD